VVPEKARRGGESLTDKDGPQEWQSQIGGVASLGGVHMEGSIEVNKRVPTAVGSVSPSIVREPIAYEDIAGPDRLCLYRDERSDRGDRLFVARRFELDGQQFYVEKLDAGDSLYIYSANDVYEVKAGDQLRYHWRVALHLVRKTVYTGDEDPPTLNREAWNGRLDDHPSAYDIDRGNVTSQRIALIKSRRGKTYESTWYTPDQMAILDVLADLSVGSRTRIAGIPVHRLDETRYDVAGERATFHEAFKRLS
jgi:hypothetical protein